MDKQELIQLHALCVLVRSHLQESQERPADAFRSYDRYDVGPTDIYRRKAEHRTALRRLLDGLETVTDGACPEASDTAVDDPDKDVQCQTPTPFTVER